MAATRRTTGALPTRGTLAGPRGAACAGAVFLLLAIAAGCGGPNTAPAPQTQHQPPAKPDAAKRTSPVTAADTSTAAGTGTSKPQALIEHRFDVSLKREGDRTPEGFIPLTLDDFEFFGPDAASQRSAWSEGDAVIRTSGRPRGYAYTRRAFRDFDLQFEYRFPENRPDDGTDPNTGTLLFLTGRHRVWPACLEAQGKFSEMAAIKSNSRDVTVEVTDDAEARRTARRAVGEWNAIRIEVRGGAVRTFLNGRPIAACKPTPLVAGPIGLQSEGFAVEFRNLQIRPLPFDVHQDHSRPSAGNSPDPSQSE